VDDEAVSATDKSGVDSPETDISKAGDIARDRAADDDTSAADEAEAE